MCVCVCARACVYSCVCLCVRVRVRYRKRELFGCVCARVVKIITGEAPLLATTLRGNIARSAICSVHTREAKEKDNKKGANRKKAMD